jgi:hypothetical protein
MNQKNILQELLQSPLVNSMNITSAPITNATDATGGWYQPWTSGTTWDFWQGYYYPYVIKESYPMYIQERSMDKGQKAFELLKILIDKKVVKLEKVSDFVEAMDAVIKVL